MVLKKLDIGRAPRIPKEGAMQVAQFIVVDPLEKHPDGGKGQAADDNHHRDSGLGPARALAGVGTPYGHAIGHAWIIHIDCPIAKPFKAGMYRPRCVHADYRPMLDSAMEKRAETQEHPFAPPAVIRVVRDHQGMARIQTRHATHHSRTARMEGDSRGTLDQ